MNLMEKFIEVIVPNERIWWGQVLYFDVLELAQSFNLSFDPNIKIQDLTLKLPFRSMIRDLIYKYTKPCKLRI
jgi:hypothetical protein